MTNNISDLYKRKIFADTKLVDEKKKMKDNVVPESKLNQIHCHSSECMYELPDNSVHLMVTSPPYNVGKEYDEDLDMDNYMGMLKSVFKECYRVLVSGGRACVNIANIGRKPYLPLNAGISMIMHELGFLMRGEIIWHKAAGAGISTAWGSWRSPSNPVLRDVHEYILVFSKESFQRVPTGHEPTLTKDQFVEWTKTIWNMNTASAKRIGHPAPFPIELPFRLINLYTFPKDVVLDPFMGSGSTALACDRSDRNWIGYDSEPDYCRLTRARLINDRRDRAKKEEGSKEESSKEAPTKPKG